MSESPDNKQLLDEVFVICGIVKVEVSPAETKARLITPRVDGYRLL